MKLGSRARFGIGKLFGLIYDIELNSSWNKLLQTVDSIMPISVINLKKAKYIYHQIGMSLSFQVNIKPKRGNKLGTYFDMGIYGFYNYSKKFRYNLELDQLSKNTSITIKNIEYFNPFEYGVLLRLGYNKATLFSKYRLSNLFNNKTNFYSIELPRFSFGIEFLFFQDTYE